MKKILKISSYALALLVAISSCKKVENQVIYEGGTAPALTANKTTAIPLSFANKDMEAIKFTWTNPNYKFNTGTSSQTVSYSIEMDVAGANFTNTTKKVISISGGALEVSFKQSEINDYLLNQLILAPAVSKDVEFRIKASLAGSAGLLYSNKIKYTVIPYAIPPKVTPPTSGELYMTGSACPSDWTNSPPTPQKFVVVTPTLYRIASIQLNGGASYLFLPDFGSWNAKFGFDGSNNANNVDGDDFRANGGDMKAPTASGLYKIEVDFQRGKFIVTRL